MQRYLLAEGGCQAEIGVASAMAAHWSRLHTTRNPSRRERRGVRTGTSPGMTCDPWPGLSRFRASSDAHSARSGMDRYAIASNEIASRHRVDLDATITSMARPQRHEQ